MKFRKTSIIIILIILVFNINIYANNEQKIVIDIGSISIALRGCTLSCDGSGK